MVVLKALKAKVRSGKVELLDFGGSVHLSGYVGTEGCGIRMRHCMQICCRSIEVVLL